VTELPDVLNMLTPSDSLESLEGAAVPREGSGTQAIERAILLLTTITGRPQLGWRLSDLAAQCFLSKATTHRILSTLVSLRLVRQRSSHGRYHSGPLLYDLALALPECFQFQAACRPHLTDLAARSRATVFLALRSGDHYVCIDQAGVAPLGLFSRPGTRRPLISAAMGASMLIELPPDAQKIIVETSIRNAVMLKDPHVEGYMQVYRRSLHCGYGLNVSDVAAGVTSVSMAMLTESGVPFASLSAIGEAATFSEARIEALLTMLREEARSIVEKHSSILEPIF
jgi:IclR family transcriptional regulator, KDG regulon repressor